MSQLINAIKKNDKASSFGLWMFISSEALLFIGLFIIYAIYRSLNPIAFQLASEELRVGVGFFDTAMIIVSLLFMRQGNVLFKKEKNGQSIFFLVLALFFGFVFLVNKYFEWKGQFTNGLFPGTDDLFRLGKGDVLFFGFYFVLTAIQSLQLLIGFVAIVVAIKRIDSNEWSVDSSVILDLITKFWYFVGLVWIVIFVLFYLI